MLVISSLGGCFSLWVLPEPTKLQVCTAAREDGILIILFVSRFTRIEYTVGTESKEH